MSAPAFVWESHARSDVGKVRKVNEDSCLDHGDRQLWVVADGMGGHAAGDVASGLIVSTLKEYAAAGTLAERVTDIEERLIAVNSELVRRAMERPDRQTMGSTVVALLAHGPHCLCLWAGDSRIYRLRDGILQRITVDHSKVQDLVDEGFLTEEDAESHPESNVITRAVGAGDLLFVDMDIHEVQAGDTFVLCSDGLYKEVREHEIESLLPGKAPQAAADALVDLTLERGSRDNVTVIVVQAHAV
jgi:serine/threonine protein phosphatase PrpC